MVAVGVLLVNLVASNLMETFSNEVTQAIDRVHWIYCVSKN